jgi:general secretion pathway protein G
MTDRRNHKARTGFTMVELMAVLIILGLLATVVVQNFVGQVDKSKVATTKANLKLLSNAVRQFYMDTGRYPTEDEQLFPLIEQPMDVENWQPGGYLETTDIPPDGWGREFEYQLYPESGKPFVIISYGADGQPGGEGYDTDLLSTDSR